RRKPLAIVGYAGSMLGRLMLYLSNGWGMVFAGRMVDRIGKGVRVAPRDALIADCTAEGRRGTAFGLHRAMDTLGAAAGVAIAIWLVGTFGRDLGRSGYQRIFLFSLIPAGLGVAALFLVREPTCAHGVRALPKLSFRGLSVRLRWFFFVVTLFALGNSSNQFLVLRARNLGMSVLAVLAAYLLYNLVYGLLSYPLGRLSDRARRKQMLVVGYVFYGLVYLGFALARQPWAVWVLFAAYGIFGALNEGLEKALVADLAPEEQRATFIGLHATLVGVGLLPASLLAGLLWSLAGPSAPFWFGGVLGLVAAIGMAVVL
ncbi:MFS transporter, partial [candidate division WOR-3 bacterium]|nr:MFS transporter [candidate division WOR-3 bacterium]